MGILVALPEIIIEIAEVVAEAAAAAAEAAAEAAAAAAEAAIDSAIDAGVEGAVQGAVDGAVDGGIDSALDSALDAAIDGISEQIGRTAGGQAMKKLVDKVGKDAAKRVIGEIKDKIKDKLKDEAKQDLKDYINGKKTPPPAPTDVAVPPVPNGINIDTLTIDVNGGQYLAAENYFKAVHGAFLQARQNENVQQMILFSSSAAHALAGMFNARNKNQVVFRLLNFDGDLGTSKWGEALTVYNAIITKFAANSTASNEEANAIVDPVKDDLQNKINDALTNTFVAPDIPLPDVSKYRGLANANKYPLKDPADYQVIEDTLKLTNTQFRAAFNVSNKTRMVQCGEFMAELTRDGLEVRKACQAAFDAIETDAAAATAAWDTMNTFWSNVQKTLTFAMTHDDLNNLLLKATPSMDAINTVQTGMLTKTAKAPQQQIDQRKSQQEQKAGAAMASAYFNPKNAPAQKPGQPGAPQQPGQPGRPGAPQKGAPGVQAQLQGQTTPQQQQQPNGQPNGQQLPPGQTPGGPKPTPTTNGAASYDPIHSAAHQAISYGATAAAPYIAGAVAPHVANVVKNAAPGVAKQVAGAVLDNLYGGSATAPAKGTVNGAAQGTQNGAAKGGATKR